MRIVPKSALTLVLVTVTAFCGFGFLASFEQPGYLVFRWLYGAVAIACLLAIATVWRMSLTRR